jgi:transcriptional regulator with XRE-family HTH domain
LGNVMDKKSDFPSGLELKIARLRAGIKQYELASEVKITPSHLSEIESGRREAPFELLQKISAAMLLLSQNTKKVF